MSRFRSAVNKAVEVGNKNNLTRTVKNYADSVVQQAGHAVVEGSKILQDRIELGSLSWWSDAGGGRWWSEAGGGRNGSCSEENSETYFTFRSDAMKECLEKDVVR
nr:coiled-coil domain-containing protein 18-like [Ipomoea batatas]